MFDSANVLLLKLDIWCGAIVLYVFAWLRWPTARYKRVGIRGETGLAKWPVRLICCVYFVRPSAQYICLYGWISFHPFDICVIFVCDWSSCFGFFFFAYFIYLFFVVVFLVAVFCLPIFNLLDLIIGYLIFAYCYKSPQCLRSTMDFFI